MEMRVRSAVQENTIVMYKQAFVCSGLLVLTQYVEMVCKGVMRDAQDLCG